MKTIFIHNIKKTLPVWITYSIILVFSFIISALLCGDFHEPKTREWFTEYSLYNINIAVYIAFCTSIALAIALFSYLQHSEACQFFHALPIKRNRLLAVNLCSGLFIMFSINTAAYIINVVISACRGVSTVGEMGLWLAVICLEELVLFSIAVLSFMITGNTAASIALFLLLSFGGTIIWIIGFGILNVFTFGFDSGLYYSGGLEYFSPVLFLDSVSSSMGYSVEYHGGVSEMLISCEGFAMKAVACLLISLIAIFLSCFVYKRRKSEQSGNIAAIDGMKPVFSAVFSFIGTAFITMLLMGDIYEGKSEIRYLQQPKIFLVISFFVSGFILFEAAWMIIEKSRSVFMKHLRKSLVFAVMMAAAGVGIICLSRYYEEYVPPKEEIDVVYITGDEGMNACRHDGEVLEEMLEIHRMAISKKDTATEEGMRDYFIGFIYKMSDGSYFRRNYRVCGDNIREKAAELKADYPSELCFHDYEFEEAVIYFEGDNRFETIYDRTLVKRLCDALKDDLESGRITYDELCRNIIPEYEPYNNGIDIYFTVSEEDEIYPEEFGQVRSSECFINRKCTATVEVCEEIFGDYFTYMLKEKEAME